MGERGHVKPVLAFLARRSGSPHRFVHLLAASLFGSTLELVLIPAILVYLGRKLDQAFGLSLAARVPHLRWLAVVAFLAGVPWLAWSIYWQHKKGEGTPLPLVPTRV